ncbi:hypothetical protein V8C42DRAFT_356363 [Trichoderma barbatum]
MTEDDCMNDCFTDNEIPSQLCNIPTPARRRSPSLSSQGCSNRSSRESLLFVPQVAKQTEQDLVLAPGDFWNEILMSRLDALVRKTQVNKPCAADVTTIVMSVTEHSERNVTKRFDEIKVDWLVVERQLQAWSYLTQNGRKLIIKVTFNYKETKTAGPAAGQGSTSGQLAERQARRDAERAVLEVLGMRDDVAEEYFAWHGSRVRRQALKEEYDRACELALGKGLDLELIHDDQDGVYQFLTDHGIMEGPARRVVRDVETFLNQLQSCND